MPIIENYASLISGYAASHIEKGILYYDRREKSCSVPPSLHHYVNGTHHLYLKQVPSALTLRKAGTRLSHDIKPTLIEEGFKFISSAMRKEDFNDNDLDIEDIEENINSHSESCDEYDVPLKETSSSGIVYEDPWKVLAGWAFAQQYLEDIPQIFVWSGGCHRLQGKLRADLFGSSRKNMTYFVNVHDHKEKMYLLFNHTHWGAYAQHARKTGRYAGEEKHPMRYFSETLYRRISFFLAGRYDPAWTVPEREKFLKDHKVLRNPKERSRRFLEVLKTVDGLFLQRYLCFPEEAWDWEKYDLFVLQAIQILITDEFFDQSVTSETLDNKFFYSQLKTARKAFKLVIHKDKPEFNELEGQPRWVETFLMSTWKRAMSLNGFQKAYAAGILSQTRGSGTPPSIVVLQSKAKFLKSVSSAPPAITRTEASIVSRSMDQVISRLPDHIFTGLDTKARITVTGSSCWEETRRTGGTAQAVLDLMAKYEHGIHIPVRDLDTGIILEWKDKDSFESIGTAVFWACLQEVLDTSLDTLREVSLTLVKEPGKARVVTKGHAALKIVLDTVSKICSYPLKKGLKSSESGMGRSHHGWNLFKDMVSEEMYSDLFKEDLSQREDDAFADHLTRISVWEDCFVASTDYQEATDKMVHHIARIISTKWMKRCGIPPILQGIVLAVAYQPRKVFFTGTGPLEEYGTSCGDGYRVLTLSRGVLMGDPLTKVVLHFCNIVARDVSTSIEDGSLFTHFTNGNECEAAYKTIVNTR